MMEKTKTTGFPFWVTLTGAILMAAMVFLPYASANEEYRTYLTAYADEAYVEEIGMTNGEAVHISLAEYLKMYMETARQGIYKETSIACIVIIAAFAGFSVLTALMALLKKPVGILIFDMLALAAFWVIRFDFKDRGVVPGSSYNLGIAGYLAYVAGAVAAAGAVWMLLAGRKIKE